ncbi:hypothetical protein [Chryseobacterium aquaeductus]|nr:hypothetical protein [Chryseobacterium aquaeductus]
MTYKIDIQHLLPINFTGSENNALSFVICNSETEALKKFQLLSRKLLEVNNWKTNAGRNPTQFYLFNRENDKSAVAQLNDLIKIKMPAPKNNIGNGFDWVAVSKIQTIDQTQMIVFLLEMKPHSCAESAKGTIAHFYTEKASNTFILAKKDNTIQFSIHGRNEKPNVNKTEVISSVRNLFVASGGIFGGSKIQWEDFTKEFIKSTS